MDISERAALVTKTLEEFFPEVSIPLNHSDPFTLLVAVLLSAQCTDARVNQVTPALFARAATPAAMASLPCHVIEALIRTCGLARTKAKALSALSKILCENFAGEVPANWEDLEALPGVGHKTASVVMTQAFHLPAFPVDTHISRCAQRWGLTASKNVIAIERDLKRLFPQEQ